MRAYLLALGLATIVMGLFLLFAGSVDIGCSVGGTSENPTVSACSGSADLTFGGWVLTIAAVIMFVGSVVPERHSSYR